MNEMTHNKNTNLGGSVKKTLLVAALAAILLFAVAGSAFAVNQSDQMRGGAAGGVNGYGGANATVPGTTTIPVVGAGTNTYEDWQPGLLGNAQTNPLAPDYAGTSPHGNYTTTTVKCVVCHAVHYAAPGVNTVASNTQAADTLLRVRADEACAFCHATAGQAVNGRPVYNGQGGAPNPGDQDLGHYSGSNCSVCHTNVHGAGADTSVASLNGYLLNTFTTVGVNGTPSLTTNNMLEAIDALNSKAQSHGFGNALPESTGAYAGINTSLQREEAVGVFCAECHNGSYAAGEAGASTSVRSGATTAAFSGHRIAAAATTTWNADGSVSSGDRTIGTVAWAEAANCKSCHDAVDDYNNAGFPHAWGKSGNASSKMWLQQAANAGAAKVSVGAAHTADNADLQLKDGVCLKCHVSSDGASGVGITF
jgi:hypothetical protein